MPNIWMDPATWNNSNDVTQNPNSEKAFIKGQKSFTKVPVKAISAEVVVTSLTPSKFHHLHLAFGFLQTFQVSRLHGVPPTFLARPKLKRRRRRASHQSFGHLLLLLKPQLASPPPTTFHAKHVLSTFGLRWGGDPTKFLSHIHFVR